LILLVTVLYCGGIGIFVVSCWFYKELSLVIVLYLWWSWNLFYSLSQGLYQEPLLVLVLITLGGSLDLKPGYLLVPFPFPGVLRLSFFPSCLEARGFTREPLSLLLTVCWDTRGGVHIPNFFNAGGFPRNPPFPGLYPGVSPFFSPGAF